MSYDEGLRTVHEQLAAPLVLPAVAEVEVCAQRVVASQRRRNAAITTLGLALACLCGAQSLIQSTATSIDAFMAGYVGLYAVVAAFCVAAGIAVWRPGTGSSVVVRSIALGTVLMSYSFSGLARDPRPRFALVDRLVGTHDTTGLWRFLRDTDIAVAAIVTAAAILLLMGRRGFDYDGSSFAPLRHRGALLIAAIGMGSAAVAGSCALAFQLSVPGPMEALTLAIAVAGPVASAIVAVGILRLRVWAVAASLPLTAFFASVALWTDVPFVVSGIWLVALPTMAPLAVLLARGLWSTVRGH